MGLRFCSGFVMRRDGRPSCDTIVGGFEARVRGQKYEGPYEMKIRHGTDVVVSRHQIQWMVQRRAKAPPNS